MANKTNSTLAKEANGTIQLNIVIPKDMINKAEQQALADVAKDAELPGFRKGKAPLSNVKANLPKETLIKKTLNLILAKIVSEAIEEHKIKPIIYPRIEVLKANEGEDWEIRALTCEMPVFDVVNYKTVVKNASKAQKGKEISREEKEQAIFKLLLETIKIQIPKILIEEEVNNKLAALLERIEKLGLTLEGYLTSLGKTTEQLRQEYETQAERTIALELILDRIAKEEKIEITDKQIDEMIKNAETDPNLKGKFESVEQRHIIEAILRKRASLDSLVALM